MKFHSLLILAFLACAGSAGADVYKRVDADGNVTYSNKPIKGGKKIELTPLPTVRAYEQNGSDYERVNQTTQRSRDDARRRVLEDELATEEKLLTEARQNLHDAQDSSRAGQAGREEDIRNAQERVDLHDRNVRALKQELSGLK